MDLRGYRMVTAVGRHPEYRGVGDYFGTGAPRRARRRTLQQWVVFAEALAKEHGGVLPRASWIKENYRGLYGVMRRHPGRFEHIPQEKPNEHHRTLEQSVAFAKALAEDHGGVLPCAKWIKKNHPGLGTAIWNHPKRFAGIRLEVRDNKDRIIGYRILGEEDKEVG